MTDNVLTTLVADKPTRLKETQSTSCNTVYKEQICDEKKTELADAENPIDHAIVVKESITIKTKRSPDAFKSHTTLTSTDAYASLESSSSSSGSQRDSDRSSASNSSEFDSSGDDCNNQSRKRRRHGVNHKRVKKSKSRTKKTNRVKKNKKKKKKKKKKDKKKDKKKQSRKRKRRNREKSSTSGVNQPYSKEELADLAEWRAKGVNPLVRKSINPARQRAKEIEQAAYLARHQQALNSHEPGSFGAMMARRKHGVMRKAIKVYRKVNAQAAKERAGIAKILSGIGLDPNKLMRK